MTVESQCTKSTEVGLNLKDMNLVIFPDKRLRLKSECVGPLDDLTVSKLLSLQEFCKLRSGIGLAAIQIGWPVQALVVNTENLKQVFINPVLLPSDAKEVSTYREGCLSLPGISVAVTRPNKVRLLYRSIDGIDKDEEFSGVEARVIQHEYAHLLGKLIIDGAEPSSIAVAIRTKTPDWKRRLRKDGRKP